MAPLSTQSPPKSPSLRAFPSQGPRDFPSHSPSFAQETGAGRTPLMRPSPSTIAPRSPFRPSSSPTRFGHARSRSTASVSSLSSAPSGVDKQVSSRPSEQQQLRSPVQEHASLPSRSPTSASPRSARPPLAAVDWIVAAAEDVENATAGRPAEARLSNGSAGQASLAGASESGVDELEKEAKRDRRIADLEIRNKSLLTLNAELERTQSKHRKEIRELRRKLRESVGGAGFAALRAQMTHVDEGIDDEADDDGSGAEDDMDGLASPAHVPDLTWPEILEGDPTFSTLAGTLEELITRAKRAIEYQPAQSEMAGRVLSAAEVEDQFATFKSHSTSTSTPGSDEGEGEDDHDDALSGITTRSSSLRGLAIAGLERPPTDACLEA